MFVETRGLTEAFAAHGTAMRLMFLVHVQHVDSQSIALLERPAHHHHTPYITHAALPYVALVKFSSSVSPQHIVIFDRMT